MDDLYWSKIKGTRDIWIAQITKPVEIFHVTNGTYAPSLGFLLGSIFASYNLRLTYGMIVVGTKDSIFL